MAFVAPLGELDAEAAETAMTMTIDELVRVRGAAPDLMDIEGFELRGIRSTNPVN